MNGTLERVWRTLEPFSRTYITLVVPGADRHRIAALHPPVLEALRRRDPELAGIALRRHFSEAGTMLGRLWPGPGASPGAATDDAARNGTTNGTAADGATDALAATDDGTPLDRAVPHPG